MNRRDFFIAAAVAVLGVVITARQYPQLRTLQILLPFAFGMAAGVLFGRAIWLSHVAS